MKTIIESLGMTIKEFSKTYEIPYNTVRQWWNGERTPPKWIIKLLNEFINSKKKGEQISIDTKYLLCANNTPMKWITCEEDKNISYSTRHGKCTNSIWECKLIEEITPV